jgi:photosystem II stability/assembly factor-like uncharacterized protein
MLPVLSLLASGASVTLAKPSAWTLQSPGTTNWQINDMAFISPDHGFFCGPNRELWETQDRGETWENRLRWNGPSIDGVQFYTVAFFDSLRGILIDNSDQPAWFTGDAGQTWQPAGGAKPYGREHLDILSPTRAFLGGWQFSTTNAGASWTMSSLNPVTANLGRIFSFDMRDAQVGLMASETYNPPIIAGTYRTADGGANWTRIADWGKVLWLDEDTALNARPYPFPPFIELPIYDRGAEIYRSDDAGVTWSLIADHVAPGLLDQQQGFWDWCRIDATTVVGVTLSGKVWRSTDAGASWTLTQPHDLIRGPVPDTTMGIRAFANQVWIFAEAGIALRSDDAGQTWSFPASGVGSPINEIAMRDAHVGLAVTAGGFVLRTTDGGKFWSQTRLNVEGIDNVLAPDRDYLEGYKNISWVTPTTVYIQGGAGNCCAGRMTMWKSIDAGLTWSYVYGLENTIRITHFDCEEMIWIDESNAYLLGYDVDPFDVGPSGYKTTDGGQTWVWMNSLLQSSVSTADFLDVNHGWIQFTQTDTAYTTNAGDSWTRVSIPGSGMNDFDMLDASVGFAVGVLGQTYRTTDGGRAWNLLPALPQVEDYYEVKVLSRTEALLVGRDNTDLTHLRFFTRHTTDAGLTWTRHDLPDEWNTRALHAEHIDALGADRVFVAGRGGLIGSNAAPRCPADLDDGSGTGTPDQGVTIDDLLYFLTAFGTGDPAADLDNGSGTGTPDGGVTIDDLIYYLTRFELGC